MAYTPVEIRHVRLKRALFGYKRPAVDELLDEIAASFEDVWRDRADLADRIEQTESALEHHREQEALLRRTLVSAERAAQEVRERAHREAELIQEEARAAAREIRRQAAADRERLLAEAGRVRSLLEAALAPIRETGAAPVPDAPLPSEPPPIEDTKAGGWAA